MAATTSQFLTGQVSFCSWETTRVPCSCRNIPVSLQSTKTFQRRLPFLTRESLPPIFREQLTLQKHKFHYQRRTTNSTRSALSKRLVVPPRKLHGGLPSLRSQRRGPVAANVLPSGGPGGEPSRSLGKYLGWATWGLIIWSALTGRLNWFFEGLTAISLAILAIPVVLLLAFLGTLAWAQSRQVEGLCPTCGTDLSIVKWADNMVVVANSIPVQLPANDDDSFDCPSCRASLKVESKKIVRGRPSFDSMVDPDPFDMSQMFGGRKPQSSGKGSAANQPIVDIEAEVLEKD